MLDILARLPRPSHYAGIEDGIVKKDASQVSLRLALAFPDTYEIGMSYLGQKILYGIINNEPRWQAERVMAPERDAGAIIRASGRKLCTIETGTPLSAMHAIGFSVTHELCYTNVLYMLDLAGIPLRQKDRTGALASWPLILAGGGAMISAEPLTPFLDLALLGDGEELLPEVLRLLERALRQNWSRDLFFGQAAEIPGVYVPSLFAHDSLGRLMPLKAGYRPARRIVADLDRAFYPTSQVAPVGAVHNRLALEIARGCGRGCRFCQAGMVYRPVRERGLATLQSLLNRSIDDSGFEEASFLSLSAGDYSALQALWDSCYERCAREHVSLSLPSLRVGSVSEAIMAKMASLRRVGCTLAPEAGSQRLRDVINKGITEDALLEHVRSLLAHGWQQVKLYFMLGLPTETDDDLAAIFELCRKARDAGGPGAPRMRITASLSPFVPKPFTPFQWEAQIDRCEIHRRINFCRDLFRRQKLLTLRWHDPDSSHLEGILARGDRRLADVVEKAYKKGAIFCNWAESFTLAPWLEALAAAGLAADAYTGAREVGSALPWDHLEAGVSSQFLLRERGKALAGRVTRDCRESGCNQCGACDTPAGASLLRAQGQDDVFRLRLVNPQSDQRPEAAACGHAAPKALPRPDAHFGRVFHYRVWHEKTGNFAYLSQLELQTALYRALRRARLPVAFSRGFHPLPLLSFGRALPVGARSEVEWFGLTLTEFLSPQKIQTGLNIFLARELGVHAVEIVDKTRKTEQSVSESFVLEWANKAAYASAVRKFADFADLESCPYARTTKKRGKSAGYSPLSGKMAGGSGQGELCHRLERSLHFPACACGGDLPGRWRSAQARKNRAVICRWQKLHARDCALNKEIA